MLLKMTRTVENMTRMGQKLISTYGTRGEKLLFDNLYTPGFDLKLPSDDLVEGQKYGKVNIHPTQPPKRH